MRWKKARQSENIEDRRGASPGKKAAVGGGIGVILIAIIAQFTGIDPSKLLGLQSVVFGGTKQAQIEEKPANLSEAEREQTQFVAAVLGDTEDTWRELFRDMERTYVEPKLVLFRNEVQSACGTAGASVGPFYCPTDQKVYIDLSFYEVLSKKLGANGDFAQAYVIAHEVGHHVQNLLGQSRMVQNKRRTASEAEGNDLSVRLELQADFYAGVWAHHARKRGLLEVGDIREAITAAAAVGDDTLQKGAGRPVRPESFTHGTSEQRMRWFQRGLESGDPDDGDTFSVRNP